MLADRLAEEKNRYDAYMKKVADEKKLMDIAFAKFEDAKRADAAGATIIQVKLDPTEIECLTRLDIPGIQSYLIGSKVLDHLQKKAFDFRSDIDIVTTATEEQIRNAFPNVYQNPYDKNTFTTFVNGIKVDIRRSSALSLSLQADAMERDFTIGAIYADKNGKIFDPTQRGLKDFFEEKTPRLESIIDAELSFTKDPIRILRALYKNINAKAAISGPLMEAIKKCLPLLKAVDPGSLHSWLLKVLIHKPRESYQTLMDLNILPLLFPNFSEIFKSNKEWIIGELEVLENHQLAHALSKSNDKAKVKKQRKPVPNDLYSIFMMSALKQKMIDQKDKNPFHVVIQENLILEDYYNRFSLDSRILTPLSDRWNQANFQEFTQPINTNIYKFYEFQENISDIYFKVNQSTSLGPHPAAFFSKIPERENEMVGRCLEQAGCDRRVSASFSEFS